MSTAIPFHTFIIKIASRCNLNCDYCFVYNRPDQEWRKQPKLMSLATAEAIAHRIEQHCLIHSKKKVSIIFHGGEPLLGSIRHLSALHDIFYTVLSKAMIETSFGMQSNGLLFDKEIGDYCLHYNIKIGISLDGPPHINDKHRRDLKGRGSGEKLHHQLQLLSSGKYAPIFSGFLCVIAIEEDPLEIYEYFKLFKPPIIDFILPYDNFDRLPPGKQNFEDESYGNWMIRLFEHWIKDSDPIPIRTFKSYISVLLGKRSYVESVGLDPVDLIVIETNGDIEAVDSLKSTFNGATKLGLNVFDHDFNKVLEQTAVKARQVGIQSLHSACISCPVVSVCGGGYLPNRYSKANNFENPSIYCKDLYKTITHIDSCLSGQLLTYRPTPNR